MKQTTAPPDAAECLRYVYITRAKCPSCGGADLHTIRSTDQGDGTRQKRTQCRSCFHKFYVVIE